MLRNHDQCRVQRRARSSRSPKWAACTIATNAWRPEFAILRTHGSSIAAPAGGVERVDSRRPAKIRSAPSPEGPPLLDRPTPARKTRLPARPHPITFLPTTVVLSSTQGSCCGSGEWISAKFQTHCRNHLGERPSRGPNCCYSCCYYCGKTYISPCRNRVGAGEGNRTLISGLGSPHSATEPHPLPPVKSITDPAGARNTSF